MVAARKLVENISVGASPRFKVLTQETREKPKNVLEFRMKDGSGFTFEKAGFKFAVNESTGLWEALTTGDVSSAFFTRQEYEVEAGRQEQPLLYEDIYDVTTNANFPKTSEIYTLGPAGVTWEEIPDGGEVSWVTLDSSSKTITMVHKGIGLEYTEDMFIYNQTWLFPGLERDFGTSLNAMLNHMHLDPIISYSYGSGNSTDAASSTAFHKTLSIQEKYVWALKLAIAAMMSDTSNPRYGPYYLLCHPLDAMTFQQALMTVPQQGVNVQLPKMNGVGMIDGIIAYHGWSGMRGKKAVSYSGVTQGTAYLIHVGHKRYDFISRFLHGLRRQNAGPKLERFVIERTIWDVRNGLYAAPARAVQKITLPDTTSGGATS